MNLYLLNLHSLVQNVVCQHAKIVMNGKQECFV